ncbi:MAG: FtsQ-type POTRA domain-containing protein [Gemmatimonadetes bacterium]|nr:FtsQ-type POTRA domain-containing protein [Gemmatimonadota bacterium]
MKRRMRIAVLVGAGCLAAASPLWGPRLLRELPWFRVRRVEVSGTRLLAPHQVLATARIPAGENVWDDLGELASALRAHPAIATATVSRDLPGTLRIRVQEKRPIAYVEMGVLAPITARGELLPVDPARTRMDLPVIRGTWAKMSPSVRRGLLAETERIGQADPTLLAHVSEIRGQGDELAVLVLSHPLAEILLPVGADLTRLAQLRAVLVDLERRLPPADPNGGASPAANVDLRFQEQIVVRLPTSGLS